MDFNLGRGELEQGVITERGLDRVGVRTQGLALPGGTRIAGRSSIGQERCPSFATAWIPLRGDCRYMPLATACPGGQGSRKALAECNSPARFLATLHGPDVCVTSLVKASVLAATT